MPDTKISALPAATAPLSAGGTFPFVQDNATRAATLQQVIDVVSAGIVSAASAQAASAINVVSNAVSNETSNRVSADNVLSQAISVVSQAVSVVSVAAGAADAHASTASAAATSADAHASAASAAATSVLAGISAVSARSVGDISTHGLQSVVNALSNRISAGGGGGSVTSTELSAVSQNASANAVSIANVVSNNASINDASIWSAVSVLRSALSAHSVGAVSTRGMQSILNALSNRISVAAGGSATPSSAQYVSLASTVSHLASIVSNVSAQSAGGSATGLQNVINMLSNKISQAGGGSGSVTSAEYSVRSIQRISAGGDGVSVKGFQSVFNALSHRLSIAQMQMVHRSDVVSVVSGNTPVDIAGLSVSLEAGGRYQLDGFVGFEKATSGGVAFGISLPAMAAGGSYLEFAVQSTNGFQANTGLVHGVAMISAVAAGTTMIISVSVTTLNVLRVIHMKGFLAVSAAGTAQIMARGSVAADSCSVRGGFLRCHRIA